MGLSSLSRFFRPLLRRRGLALARALTVAIVVAAIAAVTALASATLLQPLPFPDGDRLIQIYSLENDSTDVTDSTPLFPVEFVHLDARGPSIEAIAGIWVSDRAITGSSEPDSVTGGRVTASFFPMLGASLVSGRTFTEAEVHENAALVVLSHRLWVRMFGSDPEIVGKSIQIDRRAHTVIGVTAPAFDPVFTKTEFWTPLIFTDVTALRASVVQTVGRLRSGTSLATANHDLDAVTTAALQHIPDLTRGSSVRAFGLRDFRFGPQRSVIVMLALIVILLGLLAMANLANLTLADLTSRAHDFALRSALGGSAGAIVMAEVGPCLGLAASGATLGLWIAATAVPWILAFNPALDAGGVVVSIDWRVVLISVVSALLVMAVAVILPSWQLARRHHLGTVGASRVTDPRGGRLRAVLVGAQTAIALVLLSVSALVLTTLRRNATIDPGFDQTNVITGQLRLSENAFPDHAARAQFVRTVLQRLRETPGVTSAGTTLNLFRVGGTFTTNLSVEDAPRPDGTTYSTPFRRVSPGYFETMKIKLLRGRTFQETDSDPKTPVAVVNESFAKRYWPEGNPLGRRVKRGTATSPWAEIVGVVADNRDAGLTQDTGPVLYTCYYQNTASATPAGLVVRTVGDPGSAIRHIKEVIWSIDSAQPLSGIVVLEDFLTTSLGPQQFRSWLVGLCTICGIVLAVIGIYGVTSRSVAERTKEVGIRIALGGHPSRVWWRLVTLSLRAVAIGAAGGVALSIAVDAGMVQLLPELNGAHWAFRIGAGLCVTCAGAIAAILAARHASRIEPIIALRGD